MGIFLFLMFWPWIYVIVFGLSLDLFGHHVMAHLAKSRFMWAHYAIFVVVC